MKVIRFDCKTNQEWRAERSHSIGASAIGVLFGETHFRTPYDLAQTMRNELNGIFDFTENEAMADGHDIEDFIAKKFSRVTGYQIIKASGAEYLLRRDDIPFMHVSPDRTYWIDPDGEKHGKNAEANKGILECKSTRLIINPNDLPASWIFQVQAQMGIGGFRHAHIAWLCKTNFEFGYKKIEFDEELFNAAVEVCRDFWERCIIGGEDPDPVAPSDIIKKYPSSIEGKTITATDDIVEIITSIKEMQAASKELSAEIDEAKSKLIMMFTDEEAIVSPETGKAIVTYKTKKGATRVDSKKLKAEYPEVYDKVTTKDSDSRSLSIK